MPALHQDPLSPYYCVHVPLEKRVEQNGDSVLGHCRKKNLTQCACVCDYFPVPLHPFSHLMPFKGSLK